MSARRPSSEVNHQQMCITPPLRRPNPPNSKDASTESGRGEPSDGVGSSPGGELEKGNAAAAKSASVAVAHMAEYATARSIVLPHRFRGHAAKQLNELAGDGVDQPTLDRAVELLIDKGLSPANLESLVVMAQSRPRSVDVMSLPDSFFDD